MGREKPQTHLKGDCTAGWGEAGVLLPCPGPAALPNAILSSLPCGLPAPGTSRRPQLPWLEAGRCVRPAPTRALGPTTALSGRH